MTTYVILRGRAVLLVEETLAGAERCQANEAGTRIEARRGRHPRWTDRWYWRNL